jgi:hypothetical protein
VCNLHTEAKCLQSYRLECRSTSNRIRTGHNKVPCKQPSGCSCYYLQLPAPVFASETFLTRGSVSCCSVISLNEYMNNLLSCALLDIRFSLTIIHDVVSLILKRSRKRAMNCIVTCISIGLPNSHCHNQRCKLSGFRVMLII